jgi:hypothetical protein
MNEREDDIERARRAYDETANNPRVPRDTPPGNIRPGSHSTGGARDHQDPREGERHSSAPGAGQPPGQREPRQRDPMATRANEPPRTGRPGVDRNLDTGLTPDNDT